MMMPPTMALPDQPKDRTLSTLFQRARDSCRTQGRLPHLQIAWLALLTGRHLSALIPWMIILCNQNAGHIATSSA